MTDPSDSVPQDQRNEEQTNTPSSSQTMSDDSADLPSISQSYLDNLHDAAILSNTAALDDNFDFDGVPSKRFQPLRTRTSKKRRRTQQSEPAHIDRPITRTIWYGRCNIDYPTTNSQFIESILDLVCTIFTTNVTIPYALPCTKSFPPDIPLHQYEDLVQRRSREIFH